MKEEIIKYFEAKGFKAGRLEKLSYYNSDFEVTLYPAGLYVGKRDFTSKVTFNYSELTPETLTEQLDQICKLLKID